MNANIITNLLWFAGIGGLFYLMMRGGGCGGHRHGGAGGHQHGGRGGHAHPDQFGHSSGAPQARPPEPAQALPVDPVCGMPVASTSPALERSYMGQTFHFCSQDCLQKFDADPSKYARAPGSAEHPRRAHRC